MHVTCKIPEEMPEMRLVTEKGVVHSVALDWALFSYFPSG